MSHDGTERTKLGPGFDVQYVSGAQPTTYHGDAEMEDTASSSPQFLGETIPESTESSLGLTHSDVPAEESTRSVVMCVPFGRPASRWQRPGRHNWAVMGDFITLYI